MASLTGVAQSLGVKNVGVNVTVPQNDVAYVMYYLKCVLKGCGLDIIQDDLLDYQNYHRLSRERQDAVFLAAYTYSPDELINKTIFHDDDGSVCGTDENVFLRITEDLKLFHAQESVLIVGEQKRAASIMVFKKSWLDKFFVEPMKRNAPRLRRALIGTISDHCEHCAGRAGKCVCEKCPRTAKSKCSRTRGLTGGIFAALSEALEESIKEAQAEAGHRHCEHCKGLEATCGCEEGCVKPGKSKCIIVHKTALCDGCRKDRIVGSRYKCSQCDNYDLCQSCYRGRKHVLTHSFYLIERMGSTWQKLEPRVKPVATLVLPPPPPPPRVEVESSPKRGFFYESMSIGEMKCYLRDNLGDCDHIFEKEDLRRAVWECYCDSVSAVELGVVIKDIGLDVSDCRDITSRRNRVKAAFRVQARPAAPVRSAEFFTDQTVTLSGLKAASLNGKQGVVVNPDAPERRVDVRLEESGRTVRVKRENLVADVEIID